jgi:hypothetical protein
MPTTKENVISIRDSLQRERCPKNLFLAAKVAVAVRTASEARANINRAINEKRGYALLATSLMESRAAEREAVSALGKHRKEHGC